MAYDVDEILMGKVEVVKVVGETETILGYTTEEGVTIAVTPTYVDVKADQAVGTLKRSLTDIAGTVRFRLIQFSRALLAELWGVVSPAEVSPLEIKFDPGEPGTMTLRFKKDTYIVETVVWLGPSGEITLNKATPLGVPCEYELKGTTDASGRKVPFKVNKS